MISRNPFEVGQYINNLYLFGDNHDFLEEMVKDIYTYAKKTYPLRVMNLQVKSRD
jgi:hypothetical protein